MKVLLVIPRYNNAWGEFYQFPLGLGYITSAMKSAGHDVTVVNLNHTREEIQDTISNKIRDIDPDVCATGALSPFINLIGDIFSFSRQAKKSIINIAGGGVVSGEPDVILDAADIDIGVVDEGEETIRELLEHIESNTDLHRVKGIVFREQDGTIVRTPPRPQIKNLGALAWPDYEALQVEENIKHQRALDCYFFHTHPTSEPRCVDMISSRSCPFKCTFCFHPTGNTYRERPLDDFFNELDFLIEKYHINMIGITDELFSLKKSRLLEFCRRIKPYKIQWLIQLHVKSATPEAIRALKEAGCSSISYGIESMSPTILDSMKKKSTVAEIEHALELTYRNKIDIQGNLLFGDSAETLETANESMHWWAHNRKYQINLTPLMVFPGSPDYLEALRDGLIKDEDRLDFVKDIPININISRMNDKNLDMLRFQVCVFFRSLLNLAPVRSFDVSKKQAPGRDTAYDIHWDCPRCSHHNDYIGAVLPADARQTMRLTCRSCRSRWDIENRFYRSPYTHRISDSECFERIKTAESLFNSGDLMKSFHCTKALIEDASQFTPAHRLMGRICDQQGWMDKMIKSYGTTLLISPLDATHHMEYANGLQKIGCYGAARLHYEQCLQLDPGNQQATEAIDFINSANLSDQQRATYFISWSDAPPPERTPPTRNRPRKAEGTGATNAK